MSVRRDADTCLETADWTVTVTSPQSPAMIPTATLPAQTVEEIVTRAGRPAGLRPLGRASRPVWALLPPGAAPRPCRTSIGR